MKDGFERVVIKRLHESVEVIRHDDMFAKHIPLPGEKIQNALDEAKSFWTG